MSAEPHESPTQTLGKSTSCKRCARPNPVGNRFCGECGAPLRPRCTRKQVTVLVADVSGFTAMSERLDPEEVRGLMDSALYEHPRRALRAALAIQQSLSHIREEARRRYGVDFLLRIGIHTGPVVGGAIANELRTDYTAAGETTRVAVWLSNAAEPGHVVISDRMEPSVEGLVAPIRALAVGGELYEWVGGLTQPAAVGAGTSGWH